MDRPIHEQSDKRLGQSEARKLDLLCWLSLVLHHGKAVSIDSLQCLIAWIAIVKGQDQPFLSFQQESEAGFHCRALDELVDEDALEPVLVKELHKQVEQSKRKEVKEN